MKAQEQYAELLKLIAPTLKEAGYAKIGRSTWRKRHGDNFTVISIQGSNRNTRQEVQFTINLGVKSKRLHDFNPGPLRYPPGADYDCEWRKRIGSLLPGKTDTWWTITDGSKIQPLARDIERVLVEQAIPHLEARSDDAQLAASVGDEPPITLVEIHRAVLFRDLGDHGEYVALLNRLKEKAQSKEPYSPNLNELISRLESDV